MLLRSSSDFNDAFIDKLIVEVWLDDVPIDVGTIEQHTVDSVKINGTYYVKSQNEFRVAK